MDQYATWCRSRPQPRPHCVRWGLSSPRKGHCSPLFSAQVYCGHGHPSQLLPSSCCTAHSRVSVYFTMSNYSDHLLLSGWRFETQNFNLLLRPVWFKSTLSSNTTKSSSQLTLLLTQLNVCKDVLLSIYLPDDCTYKQVVKVIRSKSLYCIYFGASWTCFSVITPQTRTCLNEIWNISEGLVRTHTRKMGEIAPGCQNVFCFLLSLMQRAVWPLILHWLRLFLKQQMWIAFHMRTPVTNFPISAQRVFHVPQTVQNTLL